MGQYRPWQFVLPSLEEMQDDDWPEKVLDWTMFWTMLEQWMYFLRAKSRKKPKRFPKEYLAWLGLDQHDEEETKDLIQKAVSSVRERMPELKARLVPMPLLIHSENPNSLDTDPLHMTEEWVRFQDKEEAVSAPRPPWEDWDEWDLRAWMEKRRQQERWEADFARRQAQVGRYPSLNITEGNDSRFARKAEQPWREYSVAEVLDIMCQGGRSVHPDTIPVNPEDPEKPTDWYQEGVHWVPETEDFIRSIGRWTEDDQQLLTLESELGDSADGEFGGPDDGEATTYGTDEADIDGGFDDVDDD